MLTKEELSEQLLQDILKEAELKREGLHGWELTKAMIDHILGKEEPPPKPTNDTK